MFTLRSCWPALLVVTVAITAFAPHASAGTILVGPGGSIQAAVDAAQPGDTILVSPGVYRDDIVIRKSLTILGAQWTEDGCNRCNKKESIICIVSQDSMDNGFRILASNVVIKGFTFRNDGSGPRGRAIRVEGPGDGVSNIVIANNVSINNQDGFVGFRGIIRDLSIHHNWLINHYDSGIDFEAPAAGDGYEAALYENVTISRNFFTDDSNIKPEDGGAANISLVHGKNVQIIGNMIRGARKSGIRLAGGNVDVQIEDNTIKQLHSGDPDAPVIAISLLGINENVRIISNALVDNDRGINVSGTPVAPLEVHFNRIVGHAERGIRNTSSVEVDARNNWWGTNLGPGPTGPNSVSDGVVFDPWLTLGLVASPATVASEGATTLTADLMLNSAGEDTSAAGAVPDGIPVAFGASGGTLLPAWDQTQNGSASTTLKVKSSDISATATVDGETVSTVVKVVVPLAPPAKPLDLKATAANSTSIDLTWTDASDNEIGFLVYISTNGTTWSLHGIVGADVSSFESRNLKPSTKYYYSVRAYNSKGYSNASSVVSAKTFAYQIVGPAAPSDLKVVPVSISSIKLSWKDNATNESGFIVERSTDGTYFRPIGTTGANRTTFCDTSLCPNTKYCYRVKAYNCAGRSNPSNIACATTPCPPPVITNVCADPWYIKCADDRKVAVTIRYSVCSLCKPVKTWLTVEPDCTCNPVNPDDVEIVDEHHVIVKARRPLVGDKFIYRIFINATDAKGNTSKSSVKVIVDPSCTGGPCQP